MDQSPALNPSCEQSLTSAPAIVLDTNAVLDWLLFADPSMAGIATAIAGCRVRWQATAAMRQEFEHVLARGLAATRAVDVSALSARWVQHCAERPAATDAPTLRCTDPDDQMFLDLALAIGARWLVSRDRAVLRLRRHAAALGLAIVTPGQWRLE